MAREKEQAPPTNAPLIEQLKYAQTSKKSIHEIGLPQVTKKLAQEYYIFTSAIPRHPGNFLTVFRPARKHERVDTQYAKGAYKALKDEPEFKEAIATRTLGDELARRFSTITGTVEAKNLQILDPKKRKNKPDDGTFAYEAVIFTAPAEEKNGLVAALQDLPRARESSITVLTRDDPDTDSCIIALRHSTEHSARYISRLTRAVRKDDLKEKNKNNRIMLPPQKCTLDYLENTLGETISPDERAKLEAINAAYRNFTIQVTVHEGDDPVAVGKWPQALITEDAPLFQAWRDVYKNEIETRRGAHLNREQDPKRHRRPLIEERIKLKRKRARPEDVTMGPTDATTLSPIESALDEAIDFIENLKGNHWHTIPELIVQPLIGKFEVAIKAIPYALKTAIAGWHFTGDIIAWRRQKKEAKRADKHVHYLLTQLILQESIKEQK